MEWEIFINLNQEELKHLKSTTNRIEVRGHRRWLIAGLLLLGVLGLSGCHTLSFYGQAVKGQYQIFAHQRPIDKLMREAGTPQPLKERFKLLQALREFARLSLNLPIDNHYRKYVDVHRPFVVWDM
jgi:predicted aminopeptidase